MICKGAPLVSIDSFKKLNLGGKDQDRKAETGRCTGKKEVFFYERERPEYIIRRRQRNKKKGKV